MKPLALVGYIFSFCLIFMIAVIGLEQNNPNPEKVLNSLLITGLINLICFCYLVKDSIFSNNTK